MMYTLQNRKMPSSRTVQLFLIAATVFGFLSGVMPASIIFPVLAICLSTVALLSIPRITYPKILLILLAQSVLSSAISLLITRNFAFCFAAVAFAPVSALLVLTIRRRNSRTCSILLGALALGLFYLACYLLAIYLIYNRFSVELFKELYASLEKEFVTLTNEYIASYAPTAADILTDEEIADVFASIMTVMPAILADILLFVVWIATVLIRAIFIPYVYGANRFAEWRVTMNRPSAWIFCIALLVMLFPIPESLVLVAAIPANIMLILLPGFICVGCSDIKRIFFAPRRRSPFATMLTMLALILSMLLFTPIIPLFMIALLGVFHTIKPAVRPSKPENTP